MNTTKAIIYTLITTLTLKRAKTIISGSQSRDGLSNPSKMPGKGYSIPAQKCKLGSKLVKVKGSVCEGCYALKNNYSYDNVTMALRKRFSRTMNAVNAIERFGEENGAKYRNLYIASMVKLINHYSKGWFRWHDSGDLQSVAHLEIIAEIATLTPTVRHWIPTREIVMLKTWIVNGGVIPSNLTIRVSANKIGAVAMLKGAPKGIVYSSVDSGTGFRCPAPKQDNACHRCRACWSLNAKNIDYHKH
jgi:hypothetical protein